MERPVTGSEHVTFPQSKPDRNNNNKALQTWEENADGQQASLNLSELDRSACSGHIECGCTWYTGGMNRNEIDRYTAHGIKETMGGEDVNRNREPSSIIIISSDDEQPLEPRYNEDPGVGGVCDCYNAEYDRTNEASCSSLNRSNESCDSDAEHAPVTNKDYVPVTQEYMCPECSYSSKHKRYFLRHMQAKHSRNLKQYRCANCNYTTECQESFTRHFQAELHADGRAYKCTACPYTTQHEQILSGCARTAQERKQPVQGPEISNVEHKKGRADTTGREGNLPNDDAAKYTCAQCGYSGKNRRGFSAHIARAHDANAKKHKCNECSFTSKYASTLARHTRAWHDADATEYECIDCDYTSKDARNFLKHVRKTHELCNTELYRCVECGYMSKYQSALTRHVAEQHDGASQYGCLECTYATDDKRRFLKHTHGERERGEEECVGGRVKADVAKLYKCAHCPLVTKHMKYLDYHVKVRHDPEAEVYVCAQCPYSTKDKKCLFRHFRLHHDDDAEEFRCIECNYLSRDKGIFVRHFRARHAAHAIYRCGECRYTTKDERKLIGHVQKKHNGDANEV